MVRAIKKLAVFAVMATAAWVVSLMTMYFVPSHSLSWRSSAARKTATRREKVVQAFSRKTSGRLVQALRNATVIPPAPRINANEELERKYYQWKSNKINRFDFDFIITGEHICDKQPYLLIMVPSIHEHTATREAIRNTWGKIATEATWPRMTIDFRVTLVFLFGTGKSKERDDLIRDEAKVHGDIIQGDFVDSYSNLTRKMLMGLKWVSTYCSEVDFILKADEDVFVHIPNLVRMLYASEQQLKGTIYGNINRGARVRRRGKWKVSEGEFPPKFYPVYASGNSYVITGNIAPRLFRAGEYMPYLPVEDAFITGVLARMIGAGHVSDPGFTYWLQTAPDPCTFVNSTRISGNRVNIQKMFEIWKRINTEQYLCG